MDLHGRKREFFGDLAVRELAGFVKRLALDPFGHERGRSDRRAAAVGLELGVFDDALVIHLNLQAHDKRSF